MIDEKRKWKKITFFLLVCLLASLVFRLAMMLHNLDTVYNGLVLGGTCDYASDFIHPTTYCMPLGDLWLYAFGQIPWTFLGIVFSAIGIGWMIRDVVFI